MVRAPLIKAALPIWPILPLPAAAKGKVYPFICGGNVGQCDGTELVGKTPRRVQKLNAARKADFVDPSSLPGTIG